MVHDEVLHNCKKTEKRLPGEGEHSYWLRTLIKVDPWYMYFFLIPEALDFACLLGAHKPFRGEKNLRSTRLDFGALGKCKTSRDPGRENEVVLNSEIQFSAILGSLTHVLCYFAFRIWSQEKGRTGKGSSLAVFLCMMVNIDSVLLLAHAS